MELMFNILVGRNPNSWDSTRYNNIKTRLSIVRTGVETSPPKLIKIPCHLVNSVASFRVCVGCVGSVSGVCLVV